VIFVTLQRLKISNYFRIILLNINYPMISFSFDPLAAFFGVSGLIGFIFFVKGSTGKSNFNTGPNKDWDTD